MSEVKEPKVREVLIEIDNVRIKEYDNMNVEIERFEYYMNPKTKEQLSNWRFKGYSGSILGALEQIQSKELLIDKKAVSDLESYLKQVQESNERLKEAISHVG